MTSVLVFFIIFVLFPGIILGFILLSRYLRFKETQTMIEHGITPPQPQPVAPILPPVMPPVMPPQAPPMAPLPYAAPMPPMAAMRPMPPPPVMPPPMPQRPSRAQLTWGLVLSGVGIALTLALWPIGWIANSASGESGVHFPLGLGPWMLGGFIPLFVGLALILAHVIAQPERTVHHAPPQTFANGAQAPSPYPLPGNEPPFGSLPPADPSLEPTPAASSAAVPEEKPPLA